MKLRRKRSVSGDLTISLVLTVIVISALYLTLNYRLISHREQARLNDKADEYIQTLARTLEIPLWDLDYESIETICSIYYDNEMVTSVTVTEPDGRTLFRESKSAPDGAAATIERSALIRHAGQKIGRVRIGLTPAPFREANRELLQNSALTLLIAVLALAAATGLLLRTFLKQPLAELSRIARSYAKGHYRPSSPRAAYTEFQPFLSVLKEMGNTIDSQMTELREAEEKYRSIFENAVEGIFQVTSDGRFMNVNPALARIAGYDSPAEFTACVPGPGSGLFVEPEAGAAVARALRSGGELNDFQAEIRRRDGGTATVSVNAHAVRDTFGEVLFFEGTLEDVTERKRAEEALRRHRDRLEELVEERTRDLERRNEELRREVEERERAEQETRRAQALLLAAVEQTPAGILIADAPDVRIRVANEAALEIRGETERELTGIPLDLHSENWNTCRPDGSPYPPEELPLSRAIERGEVSRDELMLVRRDDGEQRWTTVNAAPVRNAEGEIVAGVVVFADVTEQVQAETERERLEAQLRQAQKMEAIGTLASGIAHDFNNVLHAIGGYVQLISMAQQPDSRTAGYVSQIESAVQRASDLVQRLLTFSRKVQPELKPVDLNREVKQAAEMLERIIPRMIAIEVKPAEDLPPVQADPDQINQVLMNLGTNARDAMPEGGRLTIETSCEELDETELRGCPNARPGSYVTLKITDTGVGMDEESLKHIFDPFFTTKSIGKGTGLGLSMVYGIVKKHRGHILCQSERGRGTAFVLRFPAIEDERPAVCKEESIELETPRGQEKILLVDDEPAVLEIGREMLEQFGYRVSTASSGEEALEFYGNNGNAADVVILDLGMPGMGGNKALRELLKMDPGARVIIASGYGADNRAKEALAEGAREFIGKPYHMRELAAKIREVLDRCES
jgi:PAS domain S-box-containing protein